MTTRGQLKKVETSHTAEINTGNVAESTADTGILVVDNKGTTTLNITTVAHLTRSTTNVMRVLNTLNISVGIEGLENLDGVLGFLDGLNGVVKNEGNFGDLINGVTTGHNEGRDSRGSQSGAESVTLLVDIDLTVPTAEDLGGGEHVTTSTHVTERTLTRTMGTTTRDTRNTSNSTTSTP
nr:60S ribosomal protein L4 [Paratrimastix eleionoma]